MAVLQQPMEHLVCRKERRRPICHLFNIYVYNQLRTFISTPVILGCQALLNACKVLIDQNIRHFGINYTSVRHFGNHTGFHLHTVFYVWTGSQFMPCSELLPKEKLAENLHPDFSPSVVCICTYKTLCTHHGLILSLTFQFHCMAAKLVQKQKLWQMPLFRAFVVFGLAGLEC